MDTVKELRDELARAKGELAKEARRRAEDEEYIAEMAGRAENQDEINEIRKKIIDNMEKTSSIQEKLIGNQQKQIDKQAEVISIQKTLIGKLDDEADKMIDRMTGLERRLSKYEEVDPPSEQGEDAEKAENG